MATMVLAVLVLAVSVAKAKDHPLPIHVRRQLLEYQNSHSSLLYSNHVDHEDLDGRRVSLSYSAEQHPGVQLLSLDQIGGLSSAAVSQGELKKKSRPVRLTS